MNVQQYIDNIETIETDKLENFETTYDINKLRDIMQDIIKYKESDYKNILSDKELINILKGIYEERKRCLECRLKNIKYNDHICVLNNSTNTYLKYDYDKNQLYKETRTPNYGSQAAIGIASILCFWHPFVFMLYDSPPATIRSTQLVTDINVIKKFTKEYVNIINKTKMHYYDEFNKNVINDIRKEITNKIVKKNENFTLSDFGRDPLRITGGMGGNAFSR